MGVGLVIGEAVQALLDGKLCIKYFTSTPGSRFGTLGTTAKANKLLSDLSKQDWSKIGATDFTDGVSLSTIAIDD